MNSEQAFKQHQQHVAKRMAELRIVRDDLTKRMAALVEIRKCVSTYGGNQVIVPGQSVPTREDQLAAIDAINADMAAAVKQIGEQLDYFDKDEQTT